MRVPEDGRVRHRIEPKTESCYVSTNRYRSLSGMIRGTLAARRHVDASLAPQREYKRLGLVLRTPYLGKRVVDHLRVMDSSIIPGWPGYIAWRLGLVGLWNRRFNPRPPRPEPGSRRPVEFARRIPVIESEADAG